MPQDNKKTSPYKAVGAIVDALEPLTVEERKRALDAALALLGGSGLLSEATASGQPPPDKGGSAHGELSVTPQPVAESRPDIRTLREKKQPRTNLEMAALVAYYLADLAPQEDRKDSIDSQDVEKYFKQAGYKLPQNAQMCLVHTKNAGYLDALGGGVYKLNPVGHNLVVHGLPRDASSPPTRRAGKRPQKTRTIGRKRRGKAVTKKRK